MSTDPPEISVPSVADWYVEVIFDLPEGGDCNYNYDYFKGTKPTRAFARQKMVPEGYKLLECRIKSIPRADRVDAASAREARASIEAGEPVISWEEVKAEADL